MTQDSTLWPEVTCQPVDVIAYPESAFPARESRGSVEPLIKAIRASSAQIVGCREKGS